MVEVSESERAHSVATGIHKAGNPQTDELLEVAQAKVSDALQSIADHIQDWKKALEKAADEAEEVEVTFGIKLTAEAGVVIIGKVTGEANYDVRILWKKSS